MNGVIARSAAEHPGGGLEPTTPTRPSRLDGLARPTSATPGLGPGHEHLAPGTGRWRLRQDGPMTNNDGYRYEPVERFGASMTNPRPWNRSALAGVELLNGRVAMLGFLAAIVGELLTGEGIVGQLALGLRLLLG